MSDTLPYVRTGSVLRRAEDGKRFVVRSIRKVATQPHTGFSHVIAHEPQPMPLVPSRQQRKRKKPQRRRH
jgi:hypothetical protein